MQKKRKADAEKSLQLSLGELLKLPQPEIKPENSSLPTPETEIKSQPKGSFLSMPSDSNFNHEQQFHLNPFFDPWNLFHEIDVEKVVQLPVQSRDITLTALTQEEIADSFASIAASESLHLPEFSIFSNNPTFSSQNSDENQPPKRVVQTINNTM